MKFYAIGGYNEVGKNMTAVKIKNEANTKEVTAKAFCLYFVK